MTRSMYGYAQAGLLGDRDRVALAEDRMRGLATAGGFLLEAVFYEFDSGDEAFEGLIAQLRRSLAADVVVPSMRHLRQRRLTPLEAEAVLHAEAGARVWVLDM